METVLKSTMLSAEKYHPIKKKIVENLYLLPVAGYFR